MHHRTHFIGLDLAWGERKPTGVAICDDEGHLLHVSAQTDDASILAAIKPFTCDDCVVGIDAPLVVTNPSGNRPCEAALNRDFRAFEAGAHPSNTGKPEFAEGPRGARLAAALDLDLDPRSTGPRRALEVYPHAASVALFRLGRTLKYKAKPGRTFEQLRSELLRLMELIAGLRHAEVPLDVTGNEQWRQLYEAVEDATSKSELRRAEDPVDAVLCAYVALYATARPDDVTVYGDVDTGYILTPTLPADLTPRSALPPVVAEYAARRPALVTSTDHYLELVTALLDDAGINYLNISARTKSVDSFAAKVGRSIDGQPLYTDPLVEITDQVGLRVITYLRDDVDAVANLLAEEMRLLDDQDMGLQTAREGRWGYASRHLLVGVEGEQQPASIQVRTVLQHAWAEFEHDVRYKGSIPAEHVSELDRKFALAAGLLELADREFTEIRDRLRSTMTEDETAFSTDSRIATPVLATYLGNRFADAGWSRTDHYGWISGLLLELGITSLDALTTVLDSVNTDEINRLMGYRYPPGAVRRLDDALLAVFTERYIGLHGNTHRITLLQNRIERLRGDS
ncbi:putative RNase H-like nuclease/ppGpp synthetase/RelA/SpoT-type nucleotidyltransferase [Mycobacterium frederiksbergense]|uniref:RNase H-like nuclease/ppGpp synthetase/RelA/SpoT-type nucleotidyltransferase n=1 Tax=Mycolicibacterium frederiksbergense TaxID=117567 RepID=A0ABT6KZH9_9MYCO|nr:bifunctional ribonuclease/(p)ppGpp synthase [Mycolicibacterium frederiksbergense]MDH6196095.1 putative RNase H-like nuclease/ppGpp synthetase/RelA/SpoT-type nucleotidyltransferase [Mycolicibacterium frederiksbergense]